MLDEGKPSSSARYFVYALTAQLRSFGVFIAPVSKLCPNSLNRVELVN